MRARRRFSGRPALVPALALAAMLVLVAGCGDDDDADARDTTTTTRTDRATSTTTSDASTSSSSAPTTTGGDGELLGDSPPSHEDAASGSGCSPGAGDLPDGWWYGRLSAAASSSELELDLACFYVGPAAEAEAASRGDEVNNDYYVVNDNPAVRSLAVAGGASAECVQLEAGLEMVACTPADVDGDWTVWVRVVDGEVDRILEQYLP